MNYNFLGLFFQAVLPGLLCEIFLLIFIIADRSFDKSTTRGFIISVIFAFLLTITDTIEYFCEGLKLFPTLRLTVGSLGYIFRTGCAFYIVRIAQRKNKIMVCLITILFIICTIISIFNLKTGNLFSIGESYDINYGKLYPFPYIVMGVWSILFLQSAIWNFRTNLGESLIIIAILITCLLANTFELFFSSKLVLAQVYSISIVFYFLSLNVELYERDSLTDLLNRRAFYLYAQKNKKRNLIVLSMDLNNLKKYNDEYGHDAGDLAIKTSASCMQKAFRKIGITYRTGGDEFMALFKEKKPEDVENAIAKFLEDLSQTEYEVACGYACYTPGMDFEEVVKEADKKMYEHKKTLKGPSRS